MNQGNDKFKVYVCSGGNFEFINNIAMYMPIDCKIVILKLPITPEKPISYRSLLKSVLKKYGLPLDSDICMKYKVDQFVIDITENVDDVEEFWSYAISNSPIEIYIVDTIRNSSGRGNNQPSSSGSGGFQQQFQHLQTQEYNQPPHFPYQNQQYQPPYYQPPYYLPPY